MLEWMWNLPAILMIYRITLAPALHFLRTLFPVGALTLSLAKLGPNYRNRLQCLLCDESWWLIKLWFMVITPICYSCGIIFSASQKYIWLMVIGFDKWNDCWKCFSILGWCSSFSSDVFLTDYFLATIAQVEDVGSGGSDEITSDSGCDKSIRIRYCIACANLLSSCYIRYDSPLAVHESKKSTLLLSRRQYIHCDLSFCCVPRIKVSY